MSKRKEFMKFYCRETETEFIYCIENVDEKSLKILEADPWWKKDGERFLKIYPMPKNNENIRDILLHGNHDNATFREVMVTLIPTLYEVHFLKQKQILSKKVKKNAKQTNCPPKQP